MKPYNFVLIGRSGAGKGTQAELLKEHFGNIVSISTGDLMRKLADKDVDAGERVRAVLAVGGLPFDDIATTLWMHEIAHTIRRDEGIICDGFPRRLVEAQNLDRFLNWLERKDTTRVLLLDVSREEAYKRLKARGRNDDTDEAIKNRLDYFEERVTPTVKFYEDQGTLININGEQAIDNVFKEILIKISNF
jgi:adenylate kinase